MEIISAIFKEYGIAGVIIFLLGKELLFLRKKRSGKWVDYGAIVKKMDSLKEEFQKHVKTDEVFMGEQKQINIRLDTTMAQMQKGIDHAVEGIDAIKDILIKRG